MLTLQQLNNLHEAAHEASICELASKVPAGLIVAQWALESGWGAHAPGNNCFGIKNYPGSLGKQLLFTSEYFTPEQFLQWLSAVPLRTGTMEDATPRKDGRFRYKVRDWFASFPSLYNCFMKRAELFHLSIYQPALNQFKMDGNFEVMVQAISKHYATDPNYAKEILDITRMKEVQDAIKEARG